MILGLPFREVWCIDFEFRPPRYPIEGDAPEVVCLVARELGSRRLIRIWQGDFPAEPPFDTGEDVLFVSFFAAAEMGCFLTLGWPMPDRLLDLYVEYRAETNGVLQADGSPHRRDLLAALKYHGVRAVTRDYKEDMRTKILAGGPWTRADRKEILDYCQSDVDPLGELLERMLLRIHRDERSLLQALLRAEYTTAVARMETNGIPIDTYTLTMIREHWGDIKEQLIKEVDRQYNVFDGTTFKEGWFAAYLTDQGIRWPRLDSGRLDLKRDTFKDMARVHPQLEELRQLRNELAKTRAVDLAVGVDGRNRALLGPFGAETGRNAPKAGRFIYGPSKWMRGLIKPEEGRAVAYIDYKYQEPVIAAALSKDAALIEAVLSGDPYIAFAKLARMVPAYATKNTHPAERSACKECILGINYGMRAKSLALRIPGGYTVIEAEALLRAMARAFPVFTAWSEKVVWDSAFRPQRTILGWPKIISSSSRSTSIKNYPMQANGAEMLRLACIMTVERGVKLLAPVHDALLVEASVEDIDEAVSITRGAMGDASEFLLRSMRVDTDVKIVRYPDRYMDDAPGAGAMWDKAVSLLGIV